MARLRYNGLQTTLGGTGLDAATTAVTFAAALTHSGGTPVPTITGTDYIPLAILNTTGALTEIVYLTAYTSGATTGTITRAQEGTTGVTHASGDSVVNGPMASDFTTATSVTFTTVTAFTNGWIDAATAGYPPVSYAKDANGFVHLRGIVKNGTAFNSAFTLPAGFRPAYKMPGANCEIGPGGTVTLLSTAQTDIGASAPFLAEL